MGHGHFLNSTGRHEYFLNSTGRHWAFLKSTRKIRTPPSRAPMTAVFLDIRQDNATLKTDILNTLDSRMTQYKNELTRDSNVVNEVVGYHSEKLQPIPEMQKVGKGQKEDLDMRIHWLEDDVESVRRATN